MRVLGVDGCRSGWLAAAHDDVAGAVTWRWSPRFADLLADPAAAVAVDIPIGLPEAGVRACDVTARLRLGRRGVCMFPAPLRPVLECSSYGEARALLAARGDRSMSAQAFGIVAAVRDVDAAMNPALESRVIEVHPEVAFTTMTGAPLPPKRSPDGIAARVAALRQWLPDVDHLVSAAPPPARTDDALDALGCAWVARRWVLGAAETLGDGARDGRGLVMRIVT